MTVTIEWGWWLLPFAITIGTFIAARVMNHEAGHGGLGDVFFSAVNYLIVCVVPSLVAWLVWSIFW